MQKGQRRHISLTGASLFHCALVRSAAVISVIVLARGWIGRQISNQAIRRVLACGGMLFAAALPPITFAENLSEAQIKAAYIYNFAKFVEWPAEVLPAGADIALCVVGTNVLDGELLGLDGRQAGARVLRVLQRSHSDADLHRCHLLFLGVSELPRFVVTIKALHDAPVLTLSDIDDFAEKGGGISLLFRDNKVVFEVNLDAIRNARLHVPGQLLNIASYVYGR